MFSIAGRFFPVSEIDIPRDDSPLLVTSSGHVIIQENEYKGISRPDGRRDYQLLYVHSGQGHFTLQGGEQPVSAGHIVIYHPLEPQYYHYLREDHSNVYWIHFSGSGVDKELRALGLYRERIYEVGARDEYARIFDTIIQELLLKRTNCRRIADCLLLQLLCLLGRACDAPQSAAIPHTKEVKQALMLFHTQFNMPFSLKDYAASCNMSVGWFARLFTRQIGMSPQQYLTNLRVTRACEMLESGATVSETSEAVGYQDPFYFSRLFKKYTGLSPMKYRFSHPYRA